MFYLLDNSSKTAPAASWLTLVRIFIEITCDKGYFLKNSKTALTNYLAKVASLCDLPHSFRASLGIEIVEHHIFWHPWSQRTKYPIDLTLSWRWSLSYRNQSIDLLWKSMDWFYMIETSVRKDRKVMLMPYYLPYHVIYLLLKQLIVTKTGARVWEDSALSYNVRGSWFQQKIFWLLDCHMFVKVRQTCNFSCYIILYFIIFFRQYRQSAQSSAMFFPETWLH